MLTPMMAKPTNFYHPNRASHQPRFGADKPPVPTLRDKAISGASSLIQDTLTQTLSENYLNKLLESAEAKKVLKTIFTPNYVKDLLDSSQIQKLTKQEMETLLTKEYLAQLLETSEAKKLLKETLSPDYIKEVSENANLRGFAKEQINSILSDPDFQRATKQSIQQTLSLLIQDAIIPLSHIGMGLSSLTLAQRQSDENIKTGMMMSGSYQLAQGTHKLLGLQKATTSKMALGATSLLASHLLLPSYCQDAAKLFGTLSLASGAIDRYGPNAPEGQLQKDFGQFTQLENLKKIPVLSHFAKLGESLSERWNQWNKPKLSLTEAAEQGDFEAFDHWIDAQADLNQTTPKGQTALSLAAANNHRAMVSTLLSLSETEVDHPDQDGRTALHHAVINHHNGVAKLLIWHDKTDLNHRDKDGRTPLHHAVILGREDLVDSLLEHGKTNIHEKDKDGWIPFYHAAHQEHVGIAKKLIDREPKMIHTKALLAQDEGKANQAFRDAAKNGNLEEVYLFVMAGVDQNATKLDGRSALYQAAENDQHTVVKVLSQTGADIDKPSLYGWTPLFHAAMKGHQAMVRTLLEAGANPGKPAKDGRTPLQAAEENGHSEIVKMLKAAKKK